MSQTTPAHYLFSSEGNCGWNIGKRSGVFGDQAGLPYKYRAVYPNPHSVLSFKVVRKRAMLRLDDICALPAGMFSLSGRKKQMDQSTRCPLLGKKSLRTNCPELCDVQSDDSISLAANERSTWVIHSLHHTKDVQGEGKVRSSTFVHHKITGDKPTSNQPTNLPRGWHLIVHPLANYTHILTHIHLHFRLPQPL